MSVKIKICGITNIEDALFAANCGANALGFIFFKDSPRFIDAPSAKEIISHLPPFLTTVGVFVNEEPEEIRKIMKYVGLDVVQLHGGEPPETCKVWSRVIKAFRINTFDDLTALSRYKSSAYLLDTYSPDQYGGTGKTFNWDIAVEAKRYGPIILSGGLNIENVELAIQWVKPYAVDVCSGIEQSKGKKDHVKMRDFIIKAKYALMRP